MSKKGWIITIVITLILIIGAGVFWWSWKQGKISFRAEEPITEKYEIVQTGIVNNTQNASPEEGISVTFPKPFATAPVVVISRTEYAQNEEMASVQNITTTGFKIKGDCVGNCSGWAWHWIATNNRNIKMEGLHMQSGRKDNLSTSTSDPKQLIVTFPEAFTSIPSVVISRSNYDQDEEMAAVKEITTTGFKIEGDCVGDCANWNWYWIATDSNNYKNDDFQLQSGSRGNNEGSSDTRGRGWLKIAFPEVFNSLPSVVISRSNYAQDEEMAAVKEITTTGFKIEGDCVGDCANWNWYWLAASGTLYLSEPLADTVPEPESTPSPSPTPVPTPDPTPTPTDQTQNQSSTSNTSTSASTGASSSSSIASNTVSGPATTGPEVPLLGGGLLGALFFVRYLINRKISK